MYIEYNNGLRMDFCGILNLRIWEVEYVLLICINCVWLERYDWNYFNIVFVILKWLDSCERGILWLIVLNVVERLRSIRIIELCWFIVMDILLWILIRVVFVLWFFL